MAMEKRTLTRRFKDHQVFEKAECGAFILQMTGGP